MKPVSIFFSLRVSFILGSRLVNGSGSGGVVGNFCPGLAVEGPMALDKYSLSLVEREGFQNPRRKKGPIHVNGLI